MSEEKLTKEEQQKLETAINFARTEPGVMAIREWLWNAREMLNLAWPKMSGDDLAKAQGYAGNLNELLRVIDTGPKIRRPIDVPTGGTQ